MSTDDTRRSFLATLGKSGVLGAGGAFGAAMSVSGDEASAQPPGARGAANVLAPVFNVRNFRKPQHAANAVPESGGTLYFPAGVYDLGAGTIRVKSKTHVLGAGAATVLRRSGHQTQGLIDARGARCVRISNLAFEIAYRGNYVTGVNLVGSAHCQVDSCTFRRVGPRPKFGETLHAIMAQGARNIRITRNHVRCMQIKAGGTGGHSSAVWITDNYFEEPFNFAISAVCASADNALCDVVIANNVVHNPTSHGGIYFGADGEGASMARCHRITVRGNTIVGSAPAKRSRAPKRIHFGIQGFVAGDCQDWNIVDNVVVFAPEHQPTHGIEIKQTRTADGHLKGLSIRNNAVRHIDKHGIGVFASVRQFDISSNQVEDTRGIVINAGRRGIHEGSVRDNIAEGKHFGIVACTSFGSITDLQIRHNICKNHLHAGIVLHRTGGHRLAADVVGNRCHDDRKNKTQKVGIREHDTSKGRGSWDTRYIDNDVRGNARSGFSRLNSKAFRRDNRTAS